ncbi:MAG: hypothetical protein COV34_00120 [Candidatus Zambryskibacteria bacterium CG10_big_fil_rev_8_21_14_0_10_42_12]|uniref:Radical SAM core domain-containing protein n=1 Tax=Candidatus Zambryskibacteria bacterium CG10_big_fil_rev_8_21_14_0_10_42_12 TaxID=1975115 RepID=A0A2H0QYR6_9BACT|nr:MAG: hypothetical protein COV34_00120 [Candidatus Zambryskibacteria bacterium CG10_big_fil_rev_8_21_14_0_10_42_12]
MEMTSLKSFRVKLVFSRTLYSQSVASVTMGSLAAYLRSLGLQTDLCLFDKNSLHNTETILGDNTQGNIVIAKPNFKDFQSMIPLLERMKRVGSVQRVFFCGPFAKLNAKDLMSRMAWLDGIFMDQLEASAARLLSTMTEDCTSWDFLSHGVISRNLKTRTVEDHRPLADPVPLSDLPFPARDIEMEENVSFVNIEASRGCLFDCSFCHIPLMSEMPSKASQLNVRDPVLVVNEIEQLNREMGKTLFIFNDSCFWSTKKDDSRILRFCDEITRRNLDVRFYVYLKGEPFAGDEVVRELAKAGLVRVFLGVENSVKSTLATYRKKVRSDLYEVVKAKLDPLGVNVHIGYITVEPHSSLDDVLSNVEYLYHIGKLFRLGVILELVRVIPGTSLHRQLLKEDLMPSKLGYDELTYGYRFVHEEVGCLLREWKKMLECQLKCVTYGFEYYSTTGELLRVLVERLDQKFTFLLRDRYEAFNQKKLHGMNTLLEYLRTSIESARIGKASLASDIDHNRHFISEFTQITNDLAVLYRGIVSLIRQNGGERAVREVYTG